MVGEGEGVSGFNVSAGCGAKSCSDRENGSCEGGGMVSELQETKVATAKGSSKGTRCCPNLVYEWVGEESIRVNGVAEKVRDECWRP